MLMLIKNLCMHESGPVQQNTSFPLRNHYTLEGERGIDCIFIRLPRDRADLHIGVPKQASDRRWVPDLSLAQTLLC
jgi:hypothetical protein